MVASVVITAHAGNGYAKSQSSSSWLDARDGVGSASKSAFSGFFATTLPVGNEGPAPYQAYQSFLWFDVDSVLPADAVPVSATFSLYPNADHGIDPGNNFNIARYNWGSVVDASNFRTVAQLQNLTKLASLQAPWTPGQQNPFYSFPEATDLAYLNPQVVQGGVIVGAGCHVAMWAYDENITSTPPTADNFASFASNNAVWASDEHPTLTIGYEVDTGLFGGLF